MKKKILKILIKTHKRCAEGFGVFQNELTDNKDSKEVNEIKKALRDLIKSGDIDFYKGTFGNLYKLTKKYKKANQL